MTVEQNTGYVAEGPLNVGFETQAKNLTYGVNAHGNRCGVLGDSSDQGNRQSDIDRVGVYGQGDNCGVFGNGHRAKVGVWGQNNGFGNPQLIGVMAAVIGSSIKEAIGVIGVSDDIIQPISLAVDENNPANGPKGSSTGVLGASGSGAGVKGLSRSNAGLMGLSDSGHGVFGQSQSSRGVGGISGTDIGVAGFSTSGHGVFGHTERGDSGVFGENLGKPSQIGVFGVSAPIPSGVTGRADHGIGVFGTSGNGDGSIGPTPFPWTVEVLGSGYSI